MPIVKTQLTSWSYSRYSTYKQCPLKCKLEYLDKLVVGTGEKSSALVYGAAVHTAVEHYLKDVTRTVPRSVAPVALELRGLKKQVKQYGRERVILEDNLAFRRDWSRTVGTDWNGAWVRIKIDLALLDLPRDGPPTLRIRDWKTGKFRNDNKDDYLEQMELYGTAGLLLFGERYPDLVVAPQLLYVDHDIAYPPADQQITYSVKDLKPLQKSWEKRVKPMLADKKFAPKPNRFCNWCAYGVSKGGPCKFG